MLWESLAFARSLTFFERCGILRLAYQASSIKCLVSGQVKLENCMRHKDYCYYYYQFIFNDVDILCYQKMTLIRVDQLKISDIQFTQ